jgi:predicted aspartyl protease
MQRIEDFKVMATLSEHQSKTSLKDIEMGRVVVDIELANADDEALHRNGYLKAGQVRRVKISALVDTGSTMISLPEDALKKLGLRVIRQATSRFANGKTEKRNIYGTATLYLMGRSAPEDVLAGHPGVPALLGHIPLEQLDLMVDPKNKRLIGGHPGSEMQVVEVY